MGRTALAGAPTGQAVHSNLLPRPTGPGTTQDNLNSAPAPSWHSSRDASGSAVNSDQQPQSQSQSYPNTYNPASFDGYLQQMGSQSDLLSSSGSNPAGSGTGLNKKRGRDDHDELETTTDSAGPLPSLKNSPFFPVLTIRPAKFHPSPSRIAELTAGFPTPPVSNGPPALITTGRMTKTHADPLIAQRALYLCPPQLAC